MLSRGIELIRCGIRLHRSSGDVGLKAKICSINIEGAVDEQLESDGIIFGSAVDEQLESCGISLRGAVDEQLESCGISPGHVIDK